MVYFTIQAPDTTPPLIWISSPENETYATTDIALTFTVGEAASWIGYSLDGQANVTVAGDTTLFGLSDGAHTITMFANDTAGNMGSSTTVYFTIDTVLPSIAVLSPQNTTYTTGSVSLSFTIDETASWMSYSLDGQANVTIAGNTTLAGLSDGTHSLVVYAGDMAGNEGSSETVHFTIQTPTVDTTPPNISVLSPETKTYATADVSLTFTVDESVAWMAYSLDGQANVTVSGNTTLTGLPDGSHSLMVYARDAAGNTGASGTISFTIDTPEEPPPAEPFPIWIIAVIVIVGGAVTAFLVFSRRSKKEQPRV